MKRIDLTEQPLDIQQLLTLAQESPVVIVADDGTTYMVALADDFEQEVSQLRESTAFQTFLETRTAAQRPRRSLTAVAEEVEAELRSTSTEE